MTRVAYIGNFEPSHSTETHVFQALEGLGHQVTQFQESAGLHIWHLNPSDYDLILWTRTGWPWESWGFSNNQVHDLQFQMLARAKALGVPTVGFHLDRWWGLPREQDIITEPFFRASLMVTADGGHPDKWKEVGVNHVWMPPAVSFYECEPMGNFRAEYATPIAFVGSWGGYHPEWVHRFDMITELRQMGARLWPDPGTTVRGQDLKDLYASTQVNVGDSCLLGGIENYWSDRIPETLGRGGFLLHPYVVGLDTAFTIGEHLDTWRLYDWDEMHKKVVYYLENVGERQRIAAAGRAHVIENHTYHNRMRSLLELL